MTERDESQGAQHVRIIVTDVTTGRERSWSASTGTGDPVMVGKALDKVVDHCREALELRDTRRAAAFDEGMQLGAQVEQRNAREALASAVLAVLGKDAGDGDIQLGALGTWRATLADGVGAREVFPNVTGA